MASHVGVAPALADAPACYVAAHLAHGALEFFAQVEPAVGNAQSQPEFDWLAALPAVNEGFDSPDDSCNHDTVDYLMASEPAWLPWW